MKRMAGGLGMGLVLLGLIVFLTGTALASESVQEIEGIVTTDYEILTDDNDVYEIGENDQAEELMNFVDRRVRATGMVQESEDGTRVILVTSFEVIEE